MVEALTPDLFRLRVISGRTSVSPVSSTSRALIDGEWPPPEVRITASRSRIRLQSVVGTLSLSLANGSWTVVDTHGLRLFSARGGAMTFAGRQARVILDLDDHEALFGLGECSGSFNRRGSTTSSCDANEPFPRDPRPFIPFICSLRHGRAAGLFWDSSAHQRWDLGRAVPDQWQMTAETGEIDLYLFLGPSIATIASAYARLTGHMPLPPRWALGYHHRADTHLSASQGVALAREFRKRHLPCDALHLGAPSMSPRGNPTWVDHPPAIARLAKRLSTLGFHLVADPDPEERDDERDSTGAARPPLMETARASREASQQRHPLERPFVVVPAGCPGIQRHAVVAANGTSSNWDRLNDTVQMLLNLSLSGVPFCGNGGGGSPEDSCPELFARWMQFSALTPFFSSPIRQGNRAREPWASGTSSEELTRKYLRLRYQLLPYLYSRFAEAHETGAPVMRPLLWHYQNDPVAVACADQFLLGRNLLVAPVLRPGVRARSVYLPNDVWSDFWTGQQFRGGQHVLADAPLDHLPLFVRAGGILPMVESHPNTGRGAHEVILLQCWPGAAGSETWYEDDGSARADGSELHLKRTISTRTVRRTFHLRLEPATGDFESSVKTWRLVLHGVRKGVRFRVNGHDTAGSWIEDTGLFVGDIPNQRDAIVVEFAAVA